MAGALSVFGLIALYRGKHMAIYFLVAAGVFVTLGTFLPGTLRPVYKYWMAFASILGWLNTRLLLGLLFFVIITPIAVIMRLFGRDALDIKWDRSRKTYWKKRKASTPAKDRFEHLY